METPAKSTSNFFFFGSFATATGGTERTILKDSAGFAAQIYFTLSRSRRTERMDDVKLKSEKHWPESGGLTIL